MTRIIYTEEYKPLSEAKIDELKRGIGKYLQRLRLDAVKRTGRKISQSDLAKALGFGAATCNQAEQGQLTISTMLQMLDFFGAVRGIDGLALLEVCEEDCIPASALRKLSKSIGLSEFEFLCVVAIFPESAYRVTHKSQVNLKSLGFAIKRVYVAEEDAYHYYAATVDYALSLNEEGWELLANKFGSSPLSEVDESSKEFFEWANETLKQAVKERPEFEHYLK